MTPVPPWVMVVVAIVMVAATIWAFAVDYRDRHPKQS